MSETGTQKGASRVCKNCGIPIDHRPKQSRHCSNLCKERFRARKRVKGLKTRPCANCGVEMTEVINFQKWCSTKCKDYARREVRRASTKKWRESNREYVQQYNKSVRKRLNAHASVRRARLKNATPEWVNFEDIADIYLKCPVGFEVDHIIPIQNDSVCGLHVPWNLQYLTVHDNRSKCNKIIEE